MCFISLELSLHVYDIYSCRVPFALTPDYVFTIEAYVVCLQLSVSQHFFFFLKSILLYTAYFYVYERSA